MGEKITLHYEKFGSERLNNAKTEIINLLEAFKIKDINCQIGIDGTYFLLTANVVDDHDKAKFFGELHSIALNFSTILRFQVKNIDNLTILVHDTSPSAKPTLN